MDRPKGKIITAPLYPLCGYSLCLFTCKKFSPSCKQQPDNEVGVDLELHLVASHLCSVLCTTKSELHISSTQRLDELKH